MKKIAIVFISMIMTVILLSACTVSTAPAVEATPEPVATAEAATQPATTASESAGLSFSVDTLTGDTIDETVITGHKLTMVNYWATWCGPCVGEIPDLQKISEDFADKDFALVGVLTGDDDIDGAKQFIADQKLTYPIVLPEAFFSDHAGDIYAIPTTMFFDSEGNQVGNTVVGAKSYEDWSGLIELLLGQVS